MTLADRLSPILVKELRQGIRSQLFTGAFLLIQGLLFLFGLFFVSTPALRAEPTAGALFFWAMLVLPLVVLVPGTASQSIEKEISGKTLELLLLTKLSSYRIVLGKWASVIVQTTLILVSAIPYIMLRYFLGGIDVWTELAAIGSLLAASALLAGIAIGFWSLQVSRLAKFGVVLLALWLVPAGLMVLLNPHVLGSPGGLGTIAWVYGTILMLMMLDSAAARIGPPSENHTSRVRALALAGLVFPYFLDGTLGGVAVTCGLFIAFGTVVGSLSEKTRTVPRLYRPFAAGSPLRRWVMFPFAPSWPGGFAFTVVALLLVPFLPVVRGQLSVTALAALLATILLPAVASRVVFRAKRPLGIYLLFLVLSSVPLYVFLFAEETGGQKLAAALAQVSGLFPPFALALALENSPPYSFATMPIAQTITLLVALASLLGMVLGAQREWERIVVFSRAAIPGNDADRTANGSVPLDVEPGATAP